MAKIEQDSNESWERKRKEKILEKNKRFIPDNQWSIIVGSVGSLIIFGLISLTLKLISIMLGASDAAATAAPAASSNSTTSAT